MSQRPYSLCQIERGIVLDHVLGGQSPQLMMALGLRGLGQPIVLLMGLPSKLHREKDILVIPELVLDPDTLLRAAILSPELTVNRIEDGKVAEKSRPELPEVLVDIVTCPNPGCITRSEEMSQRIVCCPKCKPRLRCYYCEFGFSHEEVVFI